ncbi:MAG TPA: hypothetical protein PLV25_07460, partial [Opitutales bacterium]|nr:hypothetical protein [Opitutales bacterium]
RDELRTIWSAYRPALAGRTARGRGVNVPTIDPANQENKSTVQRGEVMTAIMYSRPGWTGIKNPEWCERIAEVRPEHGKQAFDAVILVREHANDPLKIHGVLIVTDLTPETVRQCEELAPYCDTLWVAFHGRNLAMKWMFIPGFVGILCWINGNFYRERPAGNAGILGTKIGDMAKGLLLKILKR